MVTICTIPSVDDLIPPFLFHLSLLFSTVRHSKNFHAISLLTANIKNTSIILNLAKIKGLFIFWLSIGLGMMSVDDGPSCVIDAGLRVFVGILVKSLKERSSMQWKALLYVISLLLVKVITLEKIICDVFPLYYPQIVFIFSFSLLLVVLTLL